VINNESNYAKQLDFYDKCMDFVEKTVNVKHMMNN